MLVEENLLSNWSWIPICGMIRRVTSGAGLGVIRSYNGGIHPFLSPVMQRRVHALNDNFNFSESLSTHK